MMLNMLPKSHIKRYSLLALLVALMIALALWFGLFVRENQVAQELIASYGYFGIFLLGAVSGFNFIVPVPAAAFLPALVAANLTIPVAIIAITLGMTVGDMVGYFIGKASCAIITPDNRHRIDYIKRLQAQYHATPLLALFIYASFVPLPNELIVVPLGFLGYHLKHIFPVVLVGNLIFNSIVSLTLLGIFAQIM